MARVNSARAALAAELARDLGMDPDDHPLPEVLWEYQEGLLAEEEMETVRDHLALCPGCARQLLELFEEVEPEAPEGSEALPPLSDERMAELWPKLRAALALPPMVPATPIVESAGVVSLTPRRPVLERIALPLAACFFLATVGLAFWVNTLLPANRALGAPEVNVAQVDLRPKSEEGVLRGEEEKPVIPSGARSILFRLNLSDLRPFLGYRVELLDERGVQRLWSDDSLQRSVEGNFSVRIPRSRLPSGAYRFRVYGLEAGRRERIIGLEGPRELLAEYEVDLRISP